MKAQYFTLKFKDFAGEWTSREFASNSYGTVYFDQNGSGQQVCERLSTRGNALVLKEGEKLADVIRRERRRQLYQEKLLYKK